MSNKNMMKKLNVGVIVNTHGLKGEVKVKVLSDFPQLRFTKGASVYMEVQDTTLELVVKSVRFNKDMLIVLFEGYDHINDIECYKGSTLFIYEDQLQALEEDEAYFFEMMDSEVYDMEEHYVGRVVELIETGANVVLRVKREDKQTLIPFVKAFVKEFDKEQKIMHVEVMEGL